MPRRGFVCVRLSPQECAAAADWLRNSCSPDEQDPFDYPECTETAWEHWRYLVHFFEKRGRRKSAENANRVISREAAKWFGKQLFKPAIRRTRDAAVVRAAMGACITASSKHRGRPKSDRSAEEIESLNLGSASDRFGIAHRTTLFKRAEGQRAALEDFDVLE